MDRPIRELMLDGTLSRPLFVDAWESAVDAVGLMNRCRTGSVLVRDEHRLVGIFTERDVLVRLIQRNRDPRHTEVAEVMTMNPVTVTPQTTLREAMTLMHDRRVGHLPVRDGAEVGAVIVLRDITTVLAQDLDRENRALHSYIHGPALRFHGVAI